MQNSNLYQLIQSLGAVERREARRFLNSPYFNTRQDVLLLFDILCREHAPLRQEAWAGIYPEENFDDTRLRLLMSYLNKLLESFLLAQASREKGIPTRLQLAVAYRNRGLVAQYERTMRALTRDLEQQPLRNAQYHSLLRDIYLERHETVITQNPTDTESLRQLAAQTDVQYLTQRLRLICLELAQKNVYRAGADDPLHRIVLGLAEAPGRAELPAIALYRAAARMLSEPESAANYRVFKTRLTDLESCFSVEELREFYTFAINHCIRRANSGEKSQDQEVLHWYRRALDAGYLFENGLLSRFTFHNIVAAGLRCGELDWVEDFLQQFGGYLESRYRDSSLSFNKARLDYARHRYDSVLTLLQKANYRDPLLNLAAKTLLLKTYFVLGEFNLLESHLDAMRNYLHRKKVIAYHRTNYLNIVRYTERLLALGEYDRSSKSGLISEIENEPVLTEREWFLAQLGR